MKKLLACLFLFSCLGLFAQVTETYNLECSFYKDVQVPFIDTASKNLPPLNQTVFYSYRDQFTYWYKIEVKKNTRITFKITPVNDSDSYAVYLYQYNADDFCKNVFYQKAKPVKPGFYLNGTAADNPYDLSEKKFSALKNNTYYISVINTSINNCGHYLKMNDGKDTLRIKALHIPCKRNIEQLSVKTISPQVKSNTLTVTTVIKPGSDSAVKGQPVLFCISRDKIKNTVIDADPVAYDLTTSMAIEPVITELKGRKYTVSMGGTYKIKYALIGYKTFTKTVTINESFTETEALLEPLKEGDVFVMKSIYFYPNTYALKRESAGELQNLLIYLQNNENVSIEIQGHTNGDNHIAKNKAYKGLGEEWNFEGSAKGLSQKRAEAIKKYLETNGIKGERLTPKGYGGKIPVIKDPQTNEEGQMNIRVEVMILRT